MMGTIRVLVVDDEEGIRFFLKETLRQAGYHVTTAANGDDALERLRETYFDLALLDFNLGGRVDGLRVLEAAKWRWPETAVIILTAYGTLESALAAIQEGVDGYLLKPVEPAVIRQAIREVLARRKQTYNLAESVDKKRVLQGGGLLVDQEKHKVTLNGRSLKLTSGEFRLLAHLIENAHRVLTPQELVEVVHEYTSEDKREAREIIKWYIHRLRRKIEPDPSNPQYVLNVRGVGYTFGGDPSASPDAN